MKLIKINIVNTGHLCLSSASYCTVSFCDSRQFRNYWRAVTVYLVCRLLRNTWGNTKSQKGINLSYLPQYNLLKLSISFFSRSQWPCLRPLKHWDHGFESHSGHVLLFCVCVVLCVGSGLSTVWSPVQGVLPTVYRIKKLKKAAIDKFLSSYFPLRRS
jgi:hypothetical protein